MPARFRRIIHQQAQVSSVETFYSKPESLTIVLLSKYIELQPSYPWYLPKLLLKSALAIRPCNCKDASELLLPKVPRCIPVLPSLSIGKCAARVLKRSGVIREKSLNCQVHQGMKLNLDYKLIVTVRRFE